MNKTYRNEDNLKQAVEMLADRQSISNMCAALRRAIAVATGGEEHNRPYAHDSFPRLFRLGRRQFL